MKNIFVLLLVIFAAFTAWAQADTTQQVQTQEATETTVKSQTASQSQSSVPLPKSLRTKSANSNSAAGGTSSGGAKIRPQLGGTFGVSCNNYSLSLELHPQFGLYFTPWLLWGLTGTYIFTYNWDINKGYNTFGLNTYLQAYPFKKRMIVHVGYEYLNYPYSVSTDGTVTREETHNVLAGLGYRGYVSAKVSLYVLALFPVYQYNKNNHYFYPNWYVPTIRMGVSYDF